MTEAAQERSVSSLRSSAGALPVRRSDLRIEPFGSGREHVVKDLRSGELFLLGEEEHFLLLSLDGVVDAATVRATFEAELGAALDESDLDAFLETAHAQGLLVSDVPVPPAPRPGILSLRLRFWNPDRFFTRVEPRIAFVWTRAFLVVSGAAILLAGAMLWTARGELAASVEDAVHWESILLGWALIGLVSVLHECAHGLTCKHFGGEVREVGFLFLYLLPCFYCNVSDAWLFREKSKRLWVMAAGGYCDLVVAAIAVFVWRWTAAGTLAHQMAFLVLGLSTVGSLFNFNPLLKFDGYYLLSDWQEVPNLRQRAFDRLKAHARRLVWGTQPPEPEERGVFLTGFGLVAFVFSSVFLVWWSVMVVEWLSSHLGAMGAIVAGAFFLPTVVRVVRSVRNERVRWRPETRAASVR